MMHNVFPCYFRWFYDILATFCITFTRFWSHSHGLSRLSDVKMLFAFLLHFFWDQQCSQRCAIRRLKVWYRFGNAVYAVELRHFMSEKFIVTSDNSFLVYFKILDLYRLGLMVEPVMLHQFEPERTLVLCQFGCQHIYWTKFNVGFWTYC